MVLKTEGAFLLKTDNRCRHLPLVPERPEVYQN